MVQIINHICALFVGMLLAACAAGIREEDGGSGDARLDVLTSFGLALSKRDFARAAEYLADGDRMQLLGPDGKVPMEIQERLRALQLSTLYQNPTVRVSHGEISGIAESLPILAQAEKVDTLEFAGIAASPDANAEAATARFHQEDMLRETTREFFRSIRFQRWAAALNYLDEKERVVFMHRSGALRPGTRRRLFAADTSAWQALTLKSGKLVGVVLIVPPLSRVTGAAKFR